MLTDTSGDLEHYNPTVRTLEIEKQPSGNCGFDLTRSKWDPYPWVSSVECESAAHRAGLKAGDCVLEVNGEDVIGQKISDIARLVKENSHVSLLLWNVGTDPLCSPEVRNKKTFFFNIKRPLQSRDNSIHPFVTNRSR